MIYTLTLFIGELTLDLFDVDVPRHEKDNMVDAFYMEVYYGNLTIGGDYGRFLGRI